MGLNWIVIGKLLKKEQNNYKNGIKTKLPVSDVAVDGKRNNFEATAAFLLPHDPVAKKHQTSKREHAKISAVDGPSIKSGIS